MTKPFTDQEKALYELLVGSNAFTQETLAMANMHSSALARATLDGEEFAMVIGIESQQDDPDDDEYVEVIWTPLFMIPSEEMLRRIVIDGADAPSEPFTREEE